jgi:competence protein ComEC
MKRILTYFLFVFAYTFIFCVRLFFLLQAEAAETLPQHIGETARVVGVVVADPDKRATSLHLNVRVESVDTTPARGVLLALVPRDTPVLYGDHVVVSGAIIAPAPFDTDTGRTFDYAGYLRVQGVSAMIKSATVEDVVPGSWSLQKFLFSIKHTFEASIEKLFPEPDASLLEGILLGERSGLPKDLNDAFITSGLVHVVVLSGYNMSVVSENMLRITSFLPTVLNYGAATMLMILFALMSGAGATTVRALVMGVIAILARYLKRSADAMRALIVAGLGMALWNPHIILHDTSFILSMLATFGLITLSPSAEKILWWMPERFGVRAIAASTLSVQLFVLPALLYLTGVLSFLALPANILALPVVPTAMLMGFLAGVAGFVHPLLAFPFTVVADTLLRWMILVAQTEHSLPLSSTVVATFPAWVAVLFYVPLTAFASWLYYRNVSRSHSS